MFDGDYQLRKDVDKIQREIFNLDIEGGSESYYLIPSVPTISVKNSACVPSTLSFSSYLLSNEGMEFVDGKLEIYSSEDSETWTLEKQTNGHTISITPSNSKSYYKCKFFIDDCLYDVQTVPILDESSSTVVVSLQNQFQSIPCNSDGLTYSDMTLNIHYDVYLGSKRIASQVNEIVNLPNGITYVSHENSTVSNQGTITLHIAGNSQLGNTNHGLINIPIVVNDETYNKTFTWSKAIQGEDGKDGDSVHYIYCLAKTPNATLPPLPTLNATGSNKGTWTEDPTGVDHEWLYEFVAVNNKINETWQGYSTPSIWAKYGEEGDKGDKGDRGPAGTTLSPDELSKIDEVVNGNINAATINQYGSDAFIKYELDVNKIENNPSSITSGTIYSQRWGILAIITLRDVAFKVTSNHLNTYTNTGLTLQSDLKPMYRVFTTSEFDTTRIDLTTNGELRFQTPGKTTGETVTINFAQLIYFTSPTRKTTLLSFTNGTNSNNPITVSHSLTAQLKSENTPLSDKPVTFVYNGVTYQRKTDSNGSFTLQLNDDLSTNPEYKNVQIKFNGDPQYSPTSTTDRIYRRKATPADNVYLDTSTFSSDGYLQLKIGGEYGTPFKYKTLNVGIRQKNTMNITTYTLTTNHEGKVFLGKDANCDYIITCPVDGKLTEQVSFTTIT